MLNNFFWARSEFSLAIAIQNLAWGIFTPILSAFAEKFGDKKTILIGGLIYSIGLAVSSLTSSPLGHQLLNILIGAGIAGTGFGLILSVVGRASSPDKRSLVLGIATAAGSAGQVIGPPIASALLINFSWSSTFIIFSLIIIASMLFLPLLRVNPKKSNEVVKEKLSSVLIKAAKDPTYIMLFLGFFSCGFQLAFITAHFPAFISEASSPIIKGSFISLVCNSTASLGALSIAIIGLFNIFTC